MVALGCDHAGFRLKQAIMNHLGAKGIPYTDMGCMDESSVDYPVIALKVSRAVTCGEFEKGILICGTGIGMCIVANKVKGIRAALCHDVYSARMAREHNDTNILVLGQRVVGEGLAAEIVDAWFNSGFIGAQHSRRLDMIRGMEDDE